MTINGVGMGQGYELVNKTLNQPTDKMEQTKNLTQDVVGGAINKQMEHQQNMIQVNAQMQAGMGNMNAQASLISLFV